MKILINFADFENVKIGCISKQLVLVIKNAGSFFYLPIPESIHFEMTDSSIQLSCNFIKDLSILNVFQNTLNRIKGNLLNSSKKKLLLKGLGFRSNYNKESSLLTFKLGYSHLSTLTVPSFIKAVKLRKTSILLESTDLILLGNYIQKIFNLKKSDAYKGKGFSYKYNTRKLKIIKKK